MTGDIQWPEDMRPDVGIVAEEAARLLGVELEDLRGHGNLHGGKKAVMVEWCCGLSGASQREVGRYLGYRSDAGVGLARRKGRGILEEDRNLASVGQVLAKRIASSVKRGRKQCDIT